MKTLLLSDLGPIPANASVLRTRLAPVEAPGKDIGKIVPGRRYSSISTLAVSVAVSGTKHPFA